jgi:hypothetical protein
MLARSPHKSKKIFRMALGVALSIVAILGRPVGGGSGPVGNDILAGVPSTTTVASVTGAAVLGDGKSPLMRAIRGAGARPWGDTEAAVCKASDSKR